jgi:dienelactone hydrolase
LPGPERRTALEVQVSEETNAEKYIRRKITYLAEPGDRVPAYLYLPKDQKKPAAAMLCLHPTGALGKGIVAGLADKPNRAYARELAERGFVCLAPDYPSFGDYPYDFNLPGRLPSGSIKAVWNNVRAIDLLETLPEVDRDRIGCIGHSLGGHNALFTAVFDQRLRAVVSSCGFTPFHHYYGGKLAGWTSPRYMPLISSEYANDSSRVPFDFYEVVAALAPRPFFTNSPLHDSNFDVAGVKKVMEAAGQVYALYDARERLVVKYPDDGHDFPNVEREQAYQWLKQVFK